MVEEVFFQQLLLDDSKTAGFVGKRRKNVLVVMKTFVFTPTTSTTRELRTEIEAFSNRAVPMQKRIYSFFRSSSTGGFYFGFFAQLGECSTKGGG